MLQIFLIFFINDIYTSTESLSLENQTLLTKVDIQSFINENSMTHIDRNESKEESSFLFKKKGSSEVKIELETLEIMTEPSTSNNTEAILPFVTDQRDNEIKTEDNTTKKPKNKISFWAFFITRGGANLLIFTSILIVLIILLCFYSDSAILIFVMVMLVAIFLSSLLSCMVSEWKAERKR